jgi:hypothetical protein
MMRNRYGDVYHFEPINEDTFVIRGNLDHCRFGGQENQSEIDFTNLGFVDPNGGPFIGLGFMIEGRRVQRISLVGEEIHLQVSKAPAVKGLQSRHPVL